MSQAYRPAKRTVLGIDADDAVLAYERSLLEKWGYTVLTTESPQRGLSLASVYHLDALVLDYHMPAMNGHEVATAIKRCQPGILIVMFSTNEIPKNTRMLVDAVVLRDECARTAPTAVKKVKRAQQREKGGTK
jgi:CheY-like chemotaxis protein